MAETILSNPFMRDILLPFLLVFAIVFAVLQKTKIFGEGKKQTDAIIALVVGLLVVAVGYATNIIVSLIPVLAVGLVVLLVFLLLWGFAFKEGEFNVPEKVRWIIGIVAAIAVIVAVLYFTGGLGYLKNLIGGEVSGWLTNILFAVIVIIAVIAVLVGSGEKKP